MGERAVTNEYVKPAARRSSAARLPFDVPLLLIVASLLVIGLLMVYSTSLDASLRMGQEPTYLFTRQILWVLLGIGTAVGLSFLDYHFYKPFVLWALGVILVLLLIVLIRNDVRFNSSRALFEGSFQPSEFAKLGIILYLSFWLSSHRDTMNLFGDGLLPLLSIVGLTAGMIVLQPDLSAAATVVLLGILLFFLAGGDLKKLLIFVVFVVGIGAFVVSVSRTGQARISDYLSGLKDLTGSSYHVQRIYEAIIKGGMFGVGIGEADTKFTGLPLPHTDSIFAVIAEETGLVGAFVVVALYVLLLWRGLVIARRAPDQLGALISFGLTSWIGIEALMNVSVIVGLFPFTGNALPLISAGGSSMLATMGALGIVMNVARRGVVKETAERSQTSAIVDMRGRDRWRSVSGANRYGNPQE